jgi:hypothetical protein
MNKLKPTKVLQCILTKTIGADGIDNYKISNEKNCLIEDGSETFELQNIIR